MNLALNKELLAIFQVCKQCNEEKHITCFAVHSTGRRKKTCKVCIRRGFITEPEPVDRSITNKKALDWLYRKPAVIKPFRPRWAWDKEGETE